MKRLSRLVDAAMGRVPCDLLIRNVHYLDVFSLRWHRTDVAIWNGLIVGVEPGLKARRTIEAKGKFLVPGFIDAHVHIESSLMTPESFEQVVLERGTTSVICDPHEIANVMGLKGVEYFLRAALRAQMDFWVMMSSCVPATDMETNGGGPIEADELAKLARHPRALGLAEMMNVPGVLGADRKIIRKLETFQDRPMDGHCPLVSGRDLSAYASTGISSCHESSTAEEAAEKIRKGMAIWIREGSVAKDLDALAPLLTEATSMSIGFCTDDRNPLDIAQEGHIDYLIQKAIGRGVRPEVAYRSASLSVARHYGLRRVGAVAPGYVADLVLLEDPRLCSISRVFKKGKPTEELVERSASTKRFENSVRTLSVQEADLRGPEGRVHVIEVEEGRILTNRSVRNFDAPGVARLSVLERHGKKSRPANGYVRGFGERLQGAIASSVGHDSHNLICVGSNEAEMRLALEHLRASKGGFCVVQGGNVIADLALPFGGLMTTAAPERIERSLRKLRKASRSIGCELSEPFLQLAFLSLPVIPSLKLTDKGLVDVEAFRIIDVRAN